MNSSKIRNTITVSIPFFTFERKICMPQSVFLQQEIIPSEEELQKALGETYPYWKAIYKSAVDLYTVEKEGWHFSGKKYGWSYRISDKKRVLIYLLPRDGYFKVAFVFGEKAVVEIKQSGINPKIVEELLAAKAYAEGRGIRLDIKKDNEIPDVLTLLDIKNRY